MKAPPKKLNDPWNKKSDAVRSNKKEDHVSNKIWKFSNIKPRFSELFATTAKVHKNRNFST